MNNKWYVNKKVLKYIKLQYIKDLLKNRENFKIRKEKTLKIEKL